MSAFNYFLEHGYTPVFKVAALNSASTVAVWTPTTSTRIFLTGGTVASGPQSGTVALYLGNLAGTRIWQGSLLGTTTIPLGISGIESTMYDREIYARGNPGANDQWVITLQGFELP